MTGDELDGVVAVCGGDAVLDGGSGYGDGLLKIPLVEEMLPFPLTWWKLSARALVSGLTGGPETAARSRYRYVDRPAERVYPGPCRQR